MHEFSLYGQVSKDDHDRVLRQLAGVSRMQPLGTQEIHLVFKAQTPAGVSSIPSLGGSQAIVQQDASKIRAVLNGSLYYVQVVGTVEDRCQTSATRAEQLSGGNVVMQDDGNSHTSSSHQSRWAFEFRDTPDAGKQATSNRLLYRFTIEAGNLLTFMRNFGYE